MPTPSTLRTERGRYAALTRSRTPDDPELVEARRNMHAAHLAQIVAEKVAQWPPLTPEQLDRIAALLRPTSTSGDAA